MLPIQPCGISGSGGLLLHYPHDQQHQRTVTYERLQFKSATANNGKKRATQQYFYLTAQLIAQDVNQYQHVIATSQSSPLVVRGRSPGHYAEMDQRSQQRLPPSTITTMKASPSKRRKAVKEQEAILQDTPPTDINAPLSPSSLSPIPMSLASDVTTTTVATATSTHQSCQLPPPSSPSSSSSSSPSKTTSSRSVSSSSVMTQSAIITPTIPSDATSLYYLPSSFNHNRSFSANDSAWHRPYPYPPPPQQQAPQASYRPHHHHPQQPQQQHQQQWGAWSPDSTASFSTPRQHYTKPGDEKPGATTTFMMYPTTPWDARQHDPLTDYPPKQ